MKYDLALFKELNDEFRSKRLVPAPPGYAKATLLDRGAKRAAALVKKHKITGKTVLEIGCGRAEVLRALAENHKCKTYGVDIRAYDDWKSLPDTVRTFQVDLAQTDADLGVKNFDFAYSYSVWEHIAHPYSMLRRVHQLLKRKGHFFFSANLYRGPKASHLYREIYFPFPHLLFSDEVFEEFYVSKGKNPKKPSWVNCLSAADYEVFIRELGFKIKSTLYKITPLDEDFYNRFHEKLSRYPRRDLERDFVEFHLIKG